MKKSVKDLDATQLAGKKVFVRVDFNVPFQNGTISDDARIRAAIPTLSYLKEKGAKLILASHLGRPDGKVDESLRLTKVADRLSELLHQPVLKTSDCVGDEVKKSVDTLEPGDILMLENVRFHDEETQNNPDFSKALAGLADLFVNDAFGTAHRAHSSTAGIAEFIPGVAGLLIEKELNFLSEAVQHPKRPFAAIVGGSKISSKIGVITALLDKVDVLIIGGGMAYTFLKAQGFEVGKSLVEEDQLDTAKAILKKAKEEKKELILPMDHVVVGEFNNDAPQDVVSNHDFPCDKMGVDIGPKTLDKLKEVLQRMETIIWNGPLGVFEMPSFAKGTLGVAEVLAHSHAVTIIGGGDSAAAIAQAGLSDKMSHISTGGGASLEFLEGKTLPGIAVLEDK